MSELAPHRDESSSAAPWYSPGPVHSDEKIIRTVYDPEHLELDGKLKAAAVSLDDIQSKGWSVDREKFTSLRRVKRLQSKWQKQNPNRAFRVVSVGVGKIRQVGSANGESEFVVTDTALRWRPSHATVLLSTPQKPSQARKFRNDLIAALPPHTDTADAFKDVGRWGYVRGLAEQVVAVLRQILNEGLRRSLQRNAA